MMVRELLNGKDLERSGRGLILKYYPGIRQQGLRNFVINEVKLLKLQLT
jgi:hypothetical protein